MPRALRARAAVGLMLLTAAALAGCSDPEAELANVGTRLEPAATAEEPAQETTGPSSYDVEPPGPLRERLLTADVLVTSEEPLPPSVARRIGRVEGVEGVTVLSTAAASVEGRTLTVAAVDPAQFRRFTPAPTAQAAFVWDRLAGGEVVVDASVDRRLIDEQDVLTLGTREDAPEVHVGAYAPLVSRRLTVDASKPAFDVLVNARRAEQLGMPDGNALLVSTGITTPGTLRERLERIAGPDAQVQVLALELKVQAQTAVLTGTSVSAAVGTFTYTGGPHGTIRPDPAWVREYIRTEPVPILGNVTCNKAMLPQLRAALAEVVARGLADKIHPEEYAGCYYPRYIGRDPANGLSLHSWGIAVDLNVPGNLRGTVGEIDRTVVSIFKKWGFAWGGDWNYTDPMHFEMNAVVRPG